MRDLKTVTKPHLLSSSLACRLPVSGGHKHASAVVAEAYEGTEGSASHLQRQGGADSGDQHILTPQLSVTMLLKLNRTQGSDSSQRFMQIDYLNLCFIYRYDKVYNII